MVSSKDIAIGDKLLIKPDERVPVDVKVINGSATINQSSLTGESMPVDKREDDKFYIGASSENKKTVAKFATMFRPLIWTVFALVRMLTQDLMRVMTILVIACLCALVLATHTAVVAAVGHAAKKGALIKGGLKNHNEA